jgi:hypothetical protein
MLLEIADAVLQATILAWKMGWIVSGQHAEAGQDFLDVWMVEE